MKNLYLAGGCFWCISAVFLDTDGVEDVISGYCGGDEKNPTYADVKAQKTGHRETIEIIYDENVVSIKSLLELFLKSVDPFDYEGQYIDKGHSYTLAFYYQNEEEKAIFEDFIKNKEVELNKEIAIAVEPYKMFYAAEDFHQKFCKYHPQEFEQELKESGRKK